MECPICWDQIKDYSKLRYQFKCTHLFHQTCINNWIDTGNIINSTCPCCRAPYSPDEIECCTISFGNLFNSFIDLEKYTLRWNKKECFKNSHQLEISRLPKLPHDVCLYCKTCKTRQVFTYNG